VGAAFTVQQGDRQQHHRVDQDLLFGEGDTVGDREHGYVGAGVFVPAMDGQGLETGWDPDKDNQQ
jgi:hypothetical protein